MPLVPKEGMTMRRLILAALALVLVSLGLFAQEPVEFGAVIVGGSENAVYTFRNTGLLSCVLQAVGFGETYATSSGSFSVTPPAMPMELPQGATATWTVTFAPTAFGEKTGTMRIRVTCGIFSQVYSVDLTGNGILSLSDTIFTPIEPPATVEPPFLDSGECPCTTEIAGLEEDLAALDLDIAAINRYLQLTLSPSLASLTAVLTALEACCEEPSEEIQPGPFPSEGGAKFQRFVVAHKNLTLTAAANLPLIQPEAANLQSILDDAAAVVVALVPELDQVASTVASLSPSEQAVFDTYVPQAAIDFMDATTTAIADPSAHPKLKGLLGQTGQDVGQKIWKKIKIWVDKVPFVGGFIRGLMDDIDVLTDSAGDALGVAGLLFQYELERKLDGLIYGLFGITIPPNATESELEALLRRITSDSVIGRLERLEGALDGAEGQLDGIEDDIEAASEQAREIERIVRENADELGDIEEKICCLVLSLKDYARQLGLALYGEADAFEFLVPELCREASQLDCFGLRSSVDPLGPEFDAIKPEIRNIESEIERIKEMLEEILRRLGGDGIVPTEEVPPPTLIPPEEKPVVILEEQEFYWLSITKKIYVYAENTFTATSSTDEREVHVVTPAFDLSGWVDLYELRSGDIVEIEIWVNIDDDERHFMTTTFDGDDDARLVYFDELTGGRSLIVGDDIKIIFRQTASADDFATPIPIGYQFVVESQQ